MTTEPARIALDASGSARGELYLDDGDSYAHESGQIVWREFAAGPDGKTRSAPLRIRNTDLVHAFPEEAVDGVSLATFDPQNPFAQSVAAVRVERIVLLGVAKKPENVKTSDGRMLDWEVDEGWHRSPQPKYSRNRRWCTVSLRDVCVCGQRRSWKKEKTCQTFDFTKSDAQLTFNGNRPL